LNTPATGGEESAKGQLRNQEEIGGV